MQAARGKLPRTQRGSLRTILSIMATKGTKLLADMFPALSTELKELLANIREAGLAAQLPGLAIIDRCRCGDDFCGTFYIRLSQMESTARTIGACPSSRMKAW